MTEITVRDTATMGLPGRDFWRGILLRGGLTRLPRWATAPVEGVAEHAVLMPEALVQALGSLADELGLPLRSVLLAAHAKVLSVLSGEDEVITGYVTPGRPPLPCRLNTAADSWRGVLVETRRAEIELASHQDFPVEELRSELGLVEPSFEAIFDPTGVNGCELTDGTVLSLSLLQDAGFWVRLLWRTDILDADCAARIAGYHLQALSSIAADPDALHRKQSLLSATELKFQLRGLAGPRRRLPHRRVHELFGERARAQPDAIAAVYGDRQWTYRQLNAHANRLAKALLARGLRREGPDAVVTERNLEWMSAVLAIFKAGGAYLPIEPHFPADRIEKMLVRAACGIVLTEAGSTTTLDHALNSLPRTQKLFIDAVAKEDHADRDLGLCVEPDQLAYIFFTSGSTGEPKGAMCEHAGMVNHMYAKVDDLHIAEGQVVAQTGPQCFDISLWQLLAGLLIGARTLLVEQDVILDPGRFLDKVVEGRVNVLQVVPSYLEVLLSHLEQHPRELPDLRYVSVTGEAIKKELTQRWFAAQPGIKLMNAYGLTETSDDTNHEVMHEVPERDRVPLGRPINNVYAYVVDEDPSPVPLGAPGEIVFSGVCVGRGYVNDPDRTKRAFMADPHRDGQRLYRSGDIGRWRPDGKLEYLGRRDAQVKISGFRIEIGEIENALLRVPAVGDGAVVIRERGDGSKQLMAFYSGRRPIQTSTLRNRLGESLPRYMVPSAFHWRATLPLNANGKIDRKALTALAAELDLAERDHDEPRTAAERRLAAKWSKVLGIPQEQIGRRDHFFDLGGTSLSAVKLAIALGRAVSVKDLIGRPVLADLAALIDDGPERRAGLLQSLSAADGERPDALVCFPYAGGNAVNFQAMVSALRAGGMAVYAVEFPGHDLGEDGEAFAPLEQVVDRVVGEIIRLGRKRFFLWGHSSGAAFALATAKKLDTRSVKVERVFIGAQLLGDADDRRATVTELSRRSNREIAAWLSREGGYTDLGQLDRQPAQHIGAGYRHDCLTANRYFYYVLPVGGEAGRADLRRCGRGRPSHGGLPAALPRLGTLERARRPLRAR
jgi:amino acid adenylation domain-containing protein